MMLSPSLEKVVLDQRMALKLFCCIEWQLSGNRIIKLKFMGEIYSLQEERGHTINIPLLIAMIMLKPDKEKHCQYMHALPIRSKSRKKQKPLYIEELVQCGLYIYIYIQYNNLVLSKQLKPYLKGKTTTRNKLIKHEIIHYDFIPIISISTGSKE